MNKKFLKSFSIVIIFFILIIYFSQKNPANIKIVTIAGQSIVVDIADTPQSQERGLSFRNNLAENEGMLFVFNLPGEYYFWMKDMNFPIDIIWLDSDRKVVYIKKDARPELFPESYAPELDAKYVLEVVSGFSDKNNLKIGDEVLFTY